MAANINAGADASLSAGNNVTLAAGQNTRSSDLSWTATNNSWISSSATSTRITEASATAIACSVAVSAGRNLTSVGTQFKADGKLTAEGQNSQAFYEAVNVQQSSTETKSSSSLLGISLADKTTSDSSLQTTAVASRTARSRTSGENFFDLFMAPFS